MLRCTQLHTVSHCDHSILIPCLHTEPVVSSHMCNIIRPTAGLWRKGQVLFLSVQPLFFWVSKCCLSWRKWLGRKQENRKIYPCTFYFATFYSFVPSTNLYHTSTPYLHDNATWTEGAPYQNEQRCLGPHNGLKTNSSTLHVPTSTHTHPHYMTSKNWKA